MDHHSKFRLSDESLARLHNWARGCAAVAVLLAVLAFLFDIRHESDAVGDERAATAAADDSSSATVVRVPGQSQAATGSGLDGITVPQSLLSPETAGAARAGVPTLDEGASLAAGAAAGDNDRIAEQRSDAAPHVPFLSSVREGGLASLPGGAFSGSHGGGGLQAAGSRGLGRSGTTTASSAGDNTGAIDPTTFAEAPEPTERDIWSDPVATWSGLLEGSSGLDRPGPGGAGGSSDGDGGGAAPRSGAPGSGGDGGGSYAGAGPGGGTPGSGSGPGGAGPTGGDPGIGGGTPEAPGVQGPAGTSGSQEPLDPRDDIPDVPEPGTLVLVGLGLGAAAVRRRR